MTAPHRFLKLQVGRLSTREWQCMVLSETLGLWLSSIVREGIGWVRRLACLKHGPDMDGCYFPPKSSVSKSPTVTAGKWFPGIEQTLSQRRSSCLWFQIVSVETYLLFPDDQGDRGNLPGQGQAGHRGLPPLGQQILVEIVQRSRRGAGSHRRTLKNIFEVVVVVPI